MDKTIYANIYWSIIFNHFLGAKQNQRKKIELILIDDFYSDKNVKLISQFIKQDIKLRINENKNKKLLYF